MDSHTAPAFAQLHEAVRKVAAEVASAQADDVDTKARFPIETLASLREYHVLSAGVPRELGGAGGEATNPEQLFAAGYSACFIGALKFVASQKKQAFPADASITGKVGIGQIPGGFGLEVELNISLPGIDRAVAEELVAAAHQVCPYSNATRGNIDVRLNVAV